MSDQSQPNPGPRYARLFCTGRHITMFHINVNWRFETTWCVTLYRPSQLCAGWSSTWRSALLRPHLLTPPPPSWSPALARRCPTRTARATDGCPAPRCRTWSGKEEIDLASSERDLKPFLSSYSNNDCTVQYDQWIQAQFGSWSGF